LKYVVLVLLLTYSCFASANFWKNINEIENKFYTLDKNSTIKEQDVSSLIDKKYNMFSKTIEMLKNQPYTLNVKNNFLTKDFDKEKMKLLQKININKQYGYNLAVKRDNIILTNLILKEKIYNYFTFLANNWTTLSTDDIDKLTKKNLTYITSIKYKDFLTTYNNIKNIDALVDNQTKNGFIELNKHYLFFTDFLTYIEKDNTLFSYQSLSSILQFGTLIDTINSNLYFKKINIYLRFIHIDAGRLVIFFTTILIFYILNYFLYKKIYDYLRHLILKDDDEIDEILLENLKKIRKPIHLVITFIGLKLALEALSYPSGLSDNVANIFYLFYILSIAYIIFIVIDNFLFVYLVKQEVKNEVIRKELIMLMISVLKIIIFLIAFLLFLIKLNVNISGILASLGIGGLAIALAAQTTLSNFFGLLKMIFDKSFSQGDWIETKDVEGTVVEVGFISTKIRTFDNALITIPNSSLANTPIKNWNKRAVGRRIKMHIGVTYNSNIDDVKQAIQDITTMLINHKSIATPDKIDYEKSINKDYKKEQRLLSIDDKYGIKSTLLVYLDKMSDSSIDILVYTFTNTVNWQEWLDIKQDVLFKIWVIIEKNNLEFAFPSQSLYIENNGR